MAIFKPINEKTAKGKVKRIFEDIKNSRKIKKRHNRKNEMANVKFTI